MRPLNILRKAAFILTSCLLAVGCLHTRDISLGELEQDAGDAAADAGSMDKPTRFDAGFRDDDHDDDRDDPRELEPRDAGPVLDAAVAVDAVSPVDANHGEAGDDAGNDAGPVDAAARDASASGDARSLLCTLEPWHCP